MSNLKQFTSRIENPSTGEIILGTVIDEAFYVSEGYIECDGSIVLRSAYPTLSQNVDFFQNNLGVSATIISSGTSNTILDMVYANNQFVYLDANNVIGTSSNGVSWTRTTLNVFPEITYIGGKTFARTGSTSTTNLSLTDLTGGLVSGPSQGDIIFVAVATGSNTTRSQAVTGYTQVASLYADDVRDTNLWVGYKVMGSPADTTITIPSTGSTNDAQTVAIQVWRGVDSAIFDATSTTNTFTSTVLVNPPAITTVSANTVLLVIGAGTHDQESNDFYTASYLSNFLSVAETDTFSSVIGFGSIFRPTAGAYDPAAWTFSDVDSGDNSNASVTIALRRRTGADTNRIFNTLLFENGNYFLGGDYGNFARSTNLTSWVSSNIGGEILASTFGDNTYVLAGVGGFLVTSSNAITWTTRTSGTSSNIDSLVFANNTFVYAGDGGVLATSPDTVTWTARTSGTSNNINSLVFANNTFVYAGDGGVLATSPDTVTWTARTSGTSNNINDLINQGNTIYVGNGGVFATSPNNITWTARTSSTSNNLNTIAYGNGTFVLAGTNGTIATYEPYTYNYRSEFKLPTVNTTITQSQKTTAYIKT